MKKLFILELLLLISSMGFSHGFNHTWLLGPDTGFLMGKIEFDTNLYVLTQQQRKMTFEGTEATICDANGNFLMSSNGVWIANAINDTMMNGDSLNPGWDVNAHPLGLLEDNGNIFLPFPGDSSKYVLIHSAKTNQFAIDPMRIYKSVIDITLDSGLGAVILKNDTILEDTLSWGIAACKHANGRDWWVIVVTDGNPTVYKMLFTNNGIASVTTQILNFQPNTWGNAAQITFSQDGTKFIYCSPINQTQSGSVLLTDFDRCSGMFSNEQIIPISSSAYLWGLAFSPSGNFVYACSSNYIFQINTNNLIVDTVAVYDGFCYPNPPWCTTFWDMYLAANGKIYITSGSAVQHITEMNYPDNAGVACDVQQHAVNLNGIWNFRAVPNHPNYYLGPAIGSICDSLGLSIKEINHDFRFNIFPNPSNGNFNISYSLPQNKKGSLEIIDINGRKVFSQPLPQWSTLQQINLPKIAEGLYNCIITSGNSRVSKKVAIIKE